MGVIFKKDKFISWDTASKEGDYTCMVYWRKGKNGKIYIENVEYFKNKKEVKKMSRPYLEVKVVKVKKEKENYCWQCGIKMYFKHYYCPYCGNRLRKTKPKPKGNWVNGENLDKIKFPCFCSWHIPLDEDVQYGMLFKNNDGMFQLIRIEQHTYSPHVAIAENLETLIRNWNIHILKGKIIIYEEE